VPLDHQREIMLKRPDSNDEATLLAWGRRLRIAAQAGIVTPDEARRAWKRAVRRAS